MDNLERSVERAETFAAVFFDQILKDFAEHFRVNGHFLLQRLGFVDGEVVAVKHVEDASANIARVFALGVTEQLVWQDDVDLAPIVICERLEQIDVEECDTAFETVAPSLCPQSVASVP